MKQQGAILWLTGLSGAGKTTIAHGVAQELQKRNYLVELLDGDIVRTHLSQGLGFSKQDRDINVRRIGFVANLLSRNGIIAIVAAISPYREVRSELKQTTTNFIEIYVQAPLAVCESRDIKGLYAKARAGKIKHFTGISDPYEAPINADIICQTDNFTVEECVNQVLHYLERQGLIDE
ncbi:adenylyl-sulfate kinase (plasmid) [Tolypothrix tenuis PCC 7101]|uniref:Adenylyl-sulfate kinase n=1 Tax=Tolypothrix tenuis PCC 7101 TaxID=231146 RepID=A0A1Z4NBE4_9CYAN|nr:adenylyl-sulfate kinase [Aulosira sp. FACHB-113]BAZ03041.1 adenylyl-sulfate kinase [Tolypothrix tenuis PCC 7101]BAZ78221.1 adenylyl-sulfate kinase [Aulosira laxa NIES-50]